ncbi:MAG: 5'/3'-nucleotidase SurE, partial [Bryobacteraceae bacterium]
MRILVTNDDGWDAQGLTALKSLAEQLGEVYVLAPRDQHSYAGHRVTTEGPLVLVETGPRQFHLSGTPVDCVRVGVVELFPEIDWVLAGINRGGNLGADIFLSGTVGAAREAALLGKRAIAISQYVQSGRPLDWDWARNLALPMVEQLMSERCPPKGYWNLNLPHTETGC